MFSRSKFIFHLLPLYLTLFMPIFLITGPFLSDLSLSVCGLIFLINSFRSNLKKYYNNYFVKFFIIFNLIILISSLVSDYELFSLKSSFFYFRFALFSLSVWYLIDIDKNFLKYFFFTLSCSFFVLVIDGFVQYFFNKNIIGLIPEVDTHGPRISSFFGSELVMGSYLSRLFPLYFGLFIHFMKKMSNTYVNLHLIFFCLIYIIIFLTGERTAFFIINFTLIFLIFLIQGFRKNIFLVFLTLAVFFLTTLYFKPEIGNRVIKYTLSQLQSKHDDKLVLFSAMHTGHYKTGIKMFFDNKILGIGPNNFRKRCSEKKYKTLAYADSGDNMTTSCSTHPHNIYIQLLAETGIIGFSLIFSLFFSLIIFSLRILFKYKKIKIDNLTISLLGGFIINLFPLMPAGNFFNNYINIVYFLPLGFYLWSFKNNI